MYDLGDREDTAARKLASTLPALPPPVWLLTFGPTVLAARLSGYHPPSIGYAGPTQRDKVAAWLTENGLELRDYDLLGGRGKMSPYGFVFASPTY